jgi:E3 ubiquitin-protein ligase EDD1
VNTARREFLSYSLSLMRAHNAEHLDSLPVIDVSSLKHVAYVFDSLIYFLRSGTESTTASVPPQAEGGPVDFENLIVHDPDEPDDMSFSSTQNTSSLTGIDLGDYDEEVSQLSAAGKFGGKKHIFFQRSESTLCLGCPAPDPFQVSTTQLDFIAPAARWHVSSLCSIFLKIRHNGDSVIAKLFSTGKSQ